MPLKVEMELEDFDLQGEPLYDNEKLEAYAKSKNKTIDELSEEEKQPYIIGYMTL